MPADDLDDFLARLAPLSPLEQKEMLLGYFTAILAGLCPPQVEQLHAHFTVHLPPTPEKVLILEIIEGHLALRRLVGS